jgi:hypothetical protein
MNAIPVFTSDRKALRQTGIGFAIVCLVLCACMQPVTKVTSMAQTPMVRTQRAEAGDTAQYVVVFNDRKEKRAFLHSFDTFLAQYAFDTLSQDTLRQYVALRCLTPDERAAGRQPVNLMGKVDKAVFGEFDIAPPAENARPADDGQAVQPVAGGRAVLYSERPFVDELFAGLLTTLPVPAVEGTPAVFERPYFSLKTVSSRRFRLTISDTFRDGTGKAPGAFDLVEAWTAMVRNNPAEGKALFYAIAGIDAFIKGEEAVINGLQITDEKTVSFTIRQDDPQMLVRLSTPRLLPTALKAGPFFVARQEQNRMVLVSNPVCPAGMTFLDSCTVIFGNDHNPFVSFSLNQYDLITLSQIKDLEYARRSLTDKATLVSLPGEIYFLALTGASEPVRAYVAGAIDPHELLLGAAKVEGAVVRSIQLPDSIGATLQPAVPVGGQKPILTVPLRIIFRSDDRISKLCAEKIVADLTRNSIRSQLDGSSALEYERKLLKHNYDVAVGWVGAAVKSDASERQRVASIWFDDDANEQERIRTCREIPLFSVNRYALCRKNLVLYNNELARMFINTP